MESAATVPWLSAATATSLATVLGSMGSVCSFVQYMSPIPTFIKVQRDKSTGNLSPLPYCSTALLSILWVTYACITPGRIALGVTNGIGLVFQVVYMTWFFVHATSRKMTIIDYLVTALCYVAMVFVSWNLPVAITDSLGNFCVIVNILMYVAPLAVLRTIITTKDSSCMPPLYSLACLVSAVVWFGYGLTSGDAHVMIPNAAGMILGVIQLSIWAAYRNLGPAKESNRPGPELSADYTRLGV
ncbi:sugar transporter [Perkinsus chesapeaki]|uniref:Sugar transporter SWEET1 n=1 Tax=Perkinsus chesapeaki TaxID=330153 RepID=A0A7J6LFU6_PERCH|nr:sugar transporter [Perkinsus chesapeaki]